jgi:putative transposase
MSYQFIDDHRLEFDVELMIRMLEVSKSGFYDWRGRPTSTQELEDQDFGKIIEEIHTASKGRYGAPRVHAELHARGMRGSKKRVARLMRARGLCGKTRRKFKSTTDSKHKFPIAENRLERNFTAEKPDQKWLADITCLPTLEGFLFLAVVLDVFSRKIVGWSIHDSLEAKIVLDALEMARVSRRPGAGLLHHSDRGSQYASNAFQAALERLGAISSMSRKGNCWDNAMMESFFASLKNELDFEGPMKTKAVTRALVFEYINVFYNRVRLHSSLGYVSPEQFEAIRIEA